MLYFTLFYAAVSPTVLSSEDDLMERDHRNTGPVTHISKRENEKSAVFSKQNQAEIKTAFQQEKIELQEKEITKLKAELEGATKAFRQITEEASARGKTIIDNFAVFSFSIGFGSLSFILVNSWYLESTLLNAGLHHVMGYVDKGTSNTRRLV